MLHIVENRYSERGWGGDVMFKGFKTREEADEYIKEINRDNTLSYTPNIYTSASYKGLMEKVPEGYDF